MSNKIKYCLGIICYVIATIFITNYLFLEFSVFHLSSPIERMKIVCLAVLFMYIGCLILTKTNNQVFHKLPKINLTIWFILYLIMILNLTLFDKYFGRNYLIHHSISDLFDYQAMKNEFLITANTTPFKTINNLYIGYKNGNVGLEYFLRNIVGNLIAFTPLALFLPRIIKFINKWYKFFIICSIFIIGIEVCQFLMNSGAFDIDDYLLNISGTMILYILINNKFIKRLVNRIFYLEEDEVL